MKKNKLSIKDVIWLIPIVISGTIITILWFPVVLYKSFKHSSNNKK